MLSTDIGDPAVDGTSYAFCLYGADDSLLYSGVVPGGANWVLKRGKLTYRDKPRTYDGIKLMKVVSGVNGKTRARVIASNKFSTMTTLVEPPYASLPVRAQLLNTLGLCLEAQYAAPSKNLVGKFKSRGQ